MTRPTTFQKKKKKNLKFKKKLKLNKEIKKFIFFCNYSKNGNLIGFFLNFFEEKNQPNKIKNKKKIVLKWKPDWLFFEFFRREEPTKQITSLKIPLSEIDWRRKSTAMSPQIRIWALALLLFYYFIFYLLLLLLFYFLFKLLL